MTVKDLINELLECSNIHKTVTLEMENIPNEDFKYNCQNAQEVIEIDREVCISSVI